MTSVVNLYKEQYDVYIGRSGKGRDGYFGNPIRVDEVCDVCGDVHHSSGETLHCFEAYFNDRIMNDDAFKLRVIELRGKRLGCFCKPKKCHGDIIVRYLDTENHND